VKLKKIYVKQLLEQLYKEAEGDDAQVIIAWPEGEVMRIASRFDTNNLSANNKGRFLKMEDGQYVSLTNQFRKKLDSIHRYAEMDGEGAKISALASLALEDLTDTVIINLARTR